jgi:hypothetical protein
MTDKELLKELRKRIQKGFGKKCKEFQWGCCVCDVYLALEILEDSFFIKEEKDEKEIT